MKKVRFAIKYIKYLFGSINKHTIHSPFVHNLLVQVIDVKADYYRYKDVERIREQLLDSDKKILFNDFGAGGKKKNRSTKKIRNIAKRSATSEKYGQLLFRLVNHFQPLQVLELGTSLGISTAYLASAHSQTKVLTIEGSEATAEIAKQNFEKLRLKNITQFIGNFDEVLPEVLNNYAHWDVVFFDGNHLKEPTLNYFNLCLERTTYNSMFIMDDIHWSDEMEEAWNEIKNNSRVSITIDLFFMGLVFFKREEAKQHFVIRF